MKKYKADLHIHTCLSPCADWNMSPVRIVKKAREMDLEIIAVCDHNSAKNVNAVMEVGKSHGLAVIPGIEVWTKEEAHVLTLFKTLKDALYIQEKIHSRIVQKNNPDIFGFQIIADKNDQVLEEEEIMLIGSSGYSVNEITDMTAEVNGISIASHIDRPAFSILRQLGFIPPNLKLDGIEITDIRSYNKLKRENPEIERYPIVTSSDAHYRNDIGKRYTTFELRKPNLNEIKLALKNQKGRKIDRI